MKTKRAIWSFLGWTVFIFFLLFAAKKVEFYLGRAVGSHTSANYAQWISDLDKLKDGIQNKDPEAWERVTAHIDFALIGLYAIVSAIIAGLVVWWRRGSRGMPNTALEPTAIGAGSSANAGDDSSRRGSALGR